MRPRNDEEKVDITSDIEFEIELVKQIEINIDYILEMVKEYQKDGGNKDKEILADIKKAVGSSFNLRSKLELIESFIESVTPHSNVDEEWREFVNKRAEKELQEIILKLNLKDEETKTFIKKSFKDGALSTIGDGIEKIMNPVSRFSGGGKAKKKTEVIEELELYFERYSMFF